jgi:hypothetical protein
VTGIVEAAPGVINGGLTDETINWIINSAPMVRPMIAAPQRIRVSQGIPQGLVVKKVNPKYPEEARRG